MNTSYVWLNQVLIALQFIVSFLISSHDAFAGPRLVLEENFDNRGALG